MSLFINFVTFFDSDFEKELRAYTGDDPLEVWYNYAQWIEENYPKGGRDGNLQKLIESCFKTLYNTEETKDKYNDDSRVLNLWIKYVSVFFIIITTIIILTN